jgi:transcriptional regulator GlxA family with amidase domain
MIALSKQAVTRFSGVDAKRDVADVRVLRSISEIRAHLDEPVTLPELARRIGLSPED